MVRQAHHERLLEAAEAVACILREGLAAAMNRYN
jgi:hypothetical protein